MHRLDFVDGGHDHALGRSSDAPSGVSRDRAPATTSTQSEEDASRARDLSEGCAAADGALVDVAASSSGALPSCSGGFLAAGSAREDVSGDDVLLPAGVRKLWNKMPPSGASD